MMNKEIQLLIPKIQQYFAGQPINKAWLFGSCSRGEETSESDIDILVQYADNEHFIHHLPHHQFLEKDTETECRFS